MSELCLRRACLVSQCEKSRQVAPVKVGEPAIPDKMVDVEIDCSDGWDEVV